MRHRRAWIPLSVTAKFADSLRLTWHSLDVLLGVSPPTRPLKSADAFRTAGFDVVEYLNVAWVCVGAKSTDKAYTPKAYYDAVMAGVTHGVSDDISNLVYLSNPDKHVREQDQKPYNVQTWLSQNVPLTRATRSNTILPSAPPRQPSPPEPPKPPTIDRHVTPAGADSLTTICSQCLQSGTARQTVHSRDKQAAAVASALEQRIEAALAVILPHNSELSRQKPILEEMCTALIRAKEFGWRPNCSGSGRLAEAARVGF